MKKLLMELQHILNNLKDKNEIAIVKKYSCIAKRYTITLTVLAVCGSFTCIIIQFWSKLMSAIVPINISQPYLFPIMIEYFVDQEKYFYLIILHIYATLFIGGIITLGTGTILITYIQQTCGMFRIASYRIEHAMSFNILQNITLKNEILMTNGIIYAVNVHRQAMKLSKNLISVLNMMMCWIIVNNIICISINLFCIASSGYNVMELFFPFIFLLVHVMYMFISNYIGQNIIDHNNYIFSTV
ncbi:PREDICTED: uncharacterized protein LOC105557875 [Vollenhovia emeryi]|uniref:uncharacterized protein LOC105557875 n=1 Tax=Vollenhovia emeryi TaxID=411798 RepID=UPI0005F54029|nr:PREDICTED: uncharacterized protein LOC105557875 [Vollenhovia emeryi]